MKTVFALVVVLAAVASAQAWQTLTVDDFTLRWATVAGDNLAFELNAPSTGWVAVGIDPTQMMLNANFIIGYVASGTAYIRDDWGWQTTSHRADTLLGGTDDVTIDGGFEAGGSTEIHFTIPLNSGDSYDKELIVGNIYTVILAMGPNGLDDFSSPHVAVATGSIEITEMALEPYTWAAIKKL